MLTANRTDTEAASQPRRNTLPSFSVVIEWENAKLSELDRARRMLEELARQMDEIAPRLEAAPELIVLYDPDAIAQSLISSLIEPSFRNLPDVEVRMLPTEHGTYYRQKNHGARIAKRDLVMFLDSDVVPEPAWLERLLASFDDENVSIVCGNTYVEPNDLYSKSFGLFWFFPLRSTADGLEPSTHFFANNVLFRRDLFLRYGFPDQPTMRGQCIALAQNLTRDGHKIFIRNDARVSHPPPNGMTHFVKRALCEGHDQVHRRRFDGVRNGPRATLGRYKRMMADSVRRILRDRKRMGLGPAGTAGALAIAGGYYSIALAGEVLTLAHPTIVKDRFSV